MNLFKRLYATSKRWYSDRKFANMVKQERQDRDQIYTIYTLRDKEWQDRKFVERSRYSGLVPGDKPGRRTGKDNS